MNASNSSPVIPSACAAQSRQRYGFSTAGRNFVPARSASILRCISRSSRNLRNMIQVSIGRRSRSPFRPLSLRMMSRADLIRLPRDWAVVSGLSAFAFLVRGITYSRTSCSRVSGFGVISGLFRALRSLAITGLMCRPLLSLRGERSSTKQPRLYDLIIQIPPCWIYGFNPHQLFCTTPPFDLLLSLDGAFHRFVRLKPNQHLAAIPSGEAFSQSFLVLVDTLHEVRSDPRITACHSVCSPRCKRKAVSCLLPHDAAYNRFCRS